MDAERGTGRAGLANAPARAPWFPDRESIEVLEEQYADAAAAHREKGEYEASNLAADVSDRLRFYRVHREVLEAADSQEPPS